MDSPLLISSISLLLIFLAWYFQYLFLIEDGEGDSQGWWPSKSCHLNLCGTIVHQWHVNSSRLFMVRCSKHPCSASPCTNGGECSAVGCCETTIFIIIIIIAIIIIIIIIIFSAVKWDITISHQHSMSSCYRHFITMKYSVLHVMSSKAFIFNVTL